MPFLLYLRSVVLNSYNFIHLMVVFFEEIFKK